MNDLCQLTNIILDDSRAPIEHLETLDALKSALLGLTGIAGEGEDHRNDVHTEDGLAIGTEWAARCLDDVARSTKFIRGVRRAIQDRLDRSPGEPVELLYAGTGPFATLVFPLLQIFTPEQLQLTLVEINEMSVAALRRLFARPEYAGFVREIHHADCTKLELESWARIDILLSETMQFALQREHQVPITQYLAPRLRGDAVLIPQKITVGLAALEPAGGLGEWRVEPLAAPLLELTKDGLGSPVAADGVPGTEAKPHALTLPARPELEGVLALTTDIHVYGEHHLGFNDSGLTIGKTLYPEGGAAADRTFTWYYGYRPEPGVVWELEDCV